MGALVATNKPATCDAARLADELGQLEQKLVALTAEEVESKKKKSRTFDGRSWQLPEEINAVQMQIKMLHFKRSNKTSFIAKENLAVLGVTSDLELPAEALASIPSAERIEQLAKGNLIDTGAKSTHAPEERMLVYGHEHGFISAVTAAFKDHYPLALRPQHFWLMVAQGVATHVDLNAEAVRTNWVKHEGKKTLEVRCDEFVLGQPNDWASTVSGKPDSFAVQIAANTVAGVAEALAPPFSDTTSVEDIAQKIVVMDICKNYFDYKCTTMCGFPEITMEGSEHDWVLLRQAAERLLQRCKPDFAAKWGTALLPLLDKLLAARRGEVDATFWNSLCKRGGTSGSGARTWFNGWINVFFPYVERRENRYCVPYSADAGYVQEGLVYDKRYGMGGGRGIGGPDCEDFPSGMSCAPVEWAYYERSINLDFNAGFVGATQDAESLQIRPAVGWFITKRVEVPKRKMPW
eukprot:gnl/TRDRNA2_/TRDRNA2_180066_c0_seq1.p1 gnl/TRDRNA2_/TRDRNA2_180066_c0~~gnl/TRDRNA2_/TRDRNA2_180066_c0_seq1.p1  ORF type:complete len:503 (-),score=116.03 gnl/TRDRNA2_/TRDRNA2_180066_c0_seq1:90-1481(-)